jgi:hypothetical protein
VCGRGQRISENLNYILLLFFSHVSPPPPGCCAALSDPRIDVLQLVQRAAVQHRIAPLPVSISGSLHLVSKPPVLSPNFFSTETLASFGTPRQRRVLAPHQPPQRINTADPWKSPPPPPPPPPHPSPLPLSQAIAQARLRPKRARAPTLTRSTHLRSQGTPGGAADAHLFGEPAEFMKRRCRQVLRRAEQANGRSHSAHQGVRVGYICHSPQSRRARKRDGPMATARTQCSRVLSSGPH